VKDSLQYIVAKKVKKKSCFDCKKYLKKKCEVYKGKSLGVVFDCRYFKQRNKLKVEDSKNAV